MEKAKKVYQKIRERLEKIRERLDAASKYKQGQEDISYEGETIVIECFGIGNG